jgi:MFS family permease
VLVLVGASGFIVPLLCTTLVEPERRELAKQEGAPLRDVISLLAAQRKILVPLYLGMGLLSIGDYGNLAWGPSVFIRRFHFDPAMMGDQFGVVTAIGGVLGAVLGGAASDAAQRRSGSGGLFVMLGAGAIVASIGALLVSGPHPNLALAGFGLWFLASTLAATAGITTLGVIVPNEARGVSVSLVAFCNTLLGLGIGPTLVALATDHVYRNSIAVAFAITTIVLPAALFAAGLFTRTGLMLRASRHPGL